MTDLSDLLEQFTDDDNERGAAHVFGAAVDVLGRRQRRRRTRTVVAGVVALALATGGIAAIAIDANHDGFKVKTTTPAHTAVPAPSPTATAITTTSLVAPPLPGAAEGSWSLAPSGPNPVGAPVVWTGTEVIAAGSGCCDDIGTINLSAYNPSKQSWRKLPATPLTPRMEAAGAWTGSELVVAGGYADAGGSASHASAATDGAAWNASTNSWHRIAAMPTTLSGQPTAVWTGREVLVWSSSPDVGPRGGREVVLAYNPTTDHWRTLPASGLSPRRDAVTVWTGTELIVWSGDTAAINNAVVQHTQQLANDGARLDPTTDTWRRLPAAPVAARAQAAAVWSGSEVLFWGGVTVNGSDVGRGAAYDPATNRWRALPLSPLRAKAGATGVWTGRFFVVVGGAANFNLPTPGPGAAAYDPATNAWTALPAAPRYPSRFGAPTFNADQRIGAFGVWTGTSAVLLGGDDFTTEASRSDALVWTPAH